MVRNVTKCYCSVTCALGKPVNIYRLSFFTFYCISLAFNANVTTEKNTLCRSSSKSLLIVIRTGKQLETKVNFNFNPDTHFGTNHHSNAMHELRYLKKKILFHPIITPI